MQRFLLYLIALVSGFCSPLQAADSHDTSPGIAALVADLQVYEAAYDDIDAKIEVAYTDTRPVHPEDPNTSRVTQSLEQVRFSRTGGKTRVEASGEFQSPARTTATYQLSIFDGTSTYVGADDPLVNIYDGLHNHSRAVYPHRLLSFTVDPRNVRLSTYLLGDSAIAAERPEDSPLPNKTVVARVLGREEYDGLDCTHVRIDIVRVSNDKMIARWDYWLAHERNLLPVHLKGYIGRVSDSIPVAEGWVTAWTQLADGVWFPVTAETIRYDSFGIAKHQQQHQTIVRTIHVDEVTLSPDFPDGFFEHPSIPDGTQVYRINDQSEVYEAYVSGRSAASPGTAATTEPFRNWLLVGNLAAVAVVLAGVALRRRRRARNSHAH
ncbi:hypothetical protein Mal4_17830 [Maioricimonas rarisocia]|uniref:DUF3857 domain-containing protein n=1 Tax=Maioricimonas rarisocia TaxID=2528026 RepID=A0A517Z4T4_9PLAN|nr:outer membrane lipoprotein-sorting protein [Maioricimonas rarisocia]QDU37469.1 hypothetical protein Mal4_17830 [Maioricimonas rarisocia]